MDSKLPKSVALDDLVPLAQTVCEPVTGTDRPGQDASVSKLGAKQPSVFLFHSGLWLQTALCLSFHEGPGTQWPSIGIRFRLTVGPKRARVTADSLRK